MRVLGDIELSETVHEEWPNEPEDYPETIAHVIDTTSPSHTWPFQCIRILQRVLADTSTLEARLRHLEDTYQIFLPMIVRPEYGEWKGEVLQVSSDSGVLNIQLTTAGVTRSVGYGGVLFVDHGSRIPQVPLQIAFWFSMGADRLPSLSLPGAQHPSGALRNDR